MVSWLKVMSWNVGAEMSMKNIPDDRMESVKIGLKSGCVTWKKMLNITDYQGNEHNIYSSTLPHTHECDPD